jgi:trimethylamine:corrinoid methyltransferase-like protein
MRVNYQANQSVQFRLFSEDQLEELRRAALHIMSPPEVKARIEGALAAAQAGVKG